VERFHIFVIGIPERRRRNGAKANKQIKQEI
jgi:hypothetical protein